MRIHTIYKTPAEFAVAASGFGVAEWYVVRARSDNTADPGAIIFPELPEARGYCRALELVCFNPAPDASAEVVEIWAPAETAWPHGRKPGIH